MNKLKFKFLKMLNYKKLLGQYFDFLVSDYGFVETKDSKLVYPFWLSGVAYTNNKVVIIVGADDIRDMMFTVLIYRVRPDFVIPINNKEEYFTVASFLQKKGVLKDLNELCYYGETDNIKDCIENTCYWLKKYANEIFGSVI